MSRRAGRDNCRVGDLTLSDVITLVLTTGLITAVINQALGGWLAGRRQRSEQSHQRSMQEDERKHERRSRMEAAHAQAREEFLNEAANAVDWLGYEWGRHHGLEGDWVPDYDPSPAFTSVTEVIEALRRIELRHPTRRVRDLSKELRQSISGHYGSILPVWNQQVQEYEQVTGATPDFDTFAEWVKKGDALVDALHEPPDVNPGAASIQN